MPIAGGAFNSVSQLDDLNKIEAVREVIFPQDKVPEDDSSLGFIHQSAAPSFEICPVNFKINLLLKFWLLRFRRIIEELIEMS